GRQTDEERLAHHRAGDAGEEARQTSHPEAAGAGGALSSRLDQGRRPGARSVCGRGHDGGGGHGTPAPLCWRGTGGGQLEDRRPSHRSCPRPLSGPQEGGEKFMPGRTLAVLNGGELSRAVVQLGQELGLEALSEVRVARRIWGAERYIDVILIHPQTRKTLGL